MVQVASQHDLRELREELEAMERENRHDDQQSSRLLLRLVRGLEVQLAELKARVLELENPSPPVAIDTPIRFRVFVNQLP